MYISNGRGTHTASCTIGTGSFQGLESGWGVTLTPHPLLVPRSKNRVELYLYSPYGVFAAYTNGETYLHICNGFWNVKIFKYSLCCVHLKLSWNGSPSLVLFRTTLSDVITVYILWQPFEMFGLVGTHGSRDCLLLVRRCGYDTPYGVAYVTCSVFVSRREFLVRCYWCSSRVYPSDGDCHCKTSWDYVPLCRVNVCMAGMYRCFWYCRDLWCNCQYMTKDGGRNLFWKKEDADPSGLSSPTRFWGRSPADFGGSILPGAWISVCCECLVVRQRSVRLADHSSRGVLPTV